MAGIKLDPTNEDMEKAFWCVYSLPLCLIYCICSLAELLFFYIYENIRVGGAIFMVLDSTSFLNTASDILQGGSRGNEEGTSRREETFQ